MTCGREKGGLYPLKGTVSLEPKSLKSGMIPTPSLTTPDQVGCLHRLAHRFEGQRLCPFEVETSPVRWLVSPSQTAMSSPEAFFGERLELPRAAGL